MKGSYSSNVSFLDLSPYPQDSYNYSKPYLINVDGRLPPEQHLLFSKLTDHSLDDITTLVYLIFRHHQRR